MFLQRRRPRKRLTTPLANKRALPGMTPLMGPQITGLRKSLGANRATKRLFLSMHANMLPQITRIINNLLANATLVRLALANTMHLLVLDQRRRINKTL